MNVEKNRILAILPIRSGSKRVPDKNIRIVGYYPLFYHLISTCLSIDKIDTVFVSVDCERYRKIVDSYFSDDARVKVVIRPAEIATDNSKSEDAMLHAIEFLENDKEFYTQAILVQATTPLTRREDIVSGIDKLTSNSSLKSVFSASQSKRFYLDDIKTLIDRPRTQEKNTKVYENGCFWCVDLHKFKETKNRIIKPFGYIIVNEYDALDIDNTEDMYVIDKLLSARVRASEQRYFTKRAFDTKLSGNPYYQDKVDPDGNIRNLLDEKDGRIEFAKDEIQYINNLALNSNKKDLKFLSIGCGAGYAESTISKIFYKFGVEPDYEAYKISIDNMDSVINGSFDAKNYKKDFFDVILCHHVIEHVNEPIEFVRGIYSILKSGGTLIIGTPNFDGAMARRYGDNFRMLHDKTHVSLFSDFSLNDLLEDEMFLVKKVEYPYFNTKYFNSEELMKVFNKEGAGMSPAFYGNIFTIYAVKK
jgi:CMP-N-acetylneuraminic acid synthetase/2-polyprenyl-3-methyl-5-hydroxy-6-metoxy-1,4-benzoquinol methylase